MRLEFRILATAGALLTALSKAHSRGDHRVLEWQSKLSSHVDSQAETLARQYLDYDSFIFEEKEVTRGSVVPEKIQTNSVEPLMPLRQSDSDAVDANQRVLFEREPGVQFHRPSKKEKNSTGDFGRLLQNDGARLACENELSVLEAAPEAYSCRCDPDGATAYSLECESTCGEYCNSDVTACGRKELSLTFDSAGVNTVKAETFRYTRGFRPEVEIRQLQCDASGSCGSCIGRVGGEDACNSCIIQTCTDGTQAPLLNCENIEIGATLDFCSKDFSFMDGSFQFFTAGQFEDCIDPLEVPLAVCEEDRQFYEAIADKKYSCECRDNGDTSVILNCRTACGDFCNKESTVCGTEMYDQLYDLSGNLFLSAENFMYNTGRSERLLVLKEFCDREENAAVDDFTCEQCFVSVGSFNNRCQRCVLQTCSDGRQAAIFDCENLEDGNIFDLCNPESIEGEEGVFQFFNGEEFNQCLDRSPSNDVCGEDIPVLLSDGSSTIASTTFAVDDFEAPCEARSAGPGLWYKVIGTGIGIEASTCGDNTDFDTAISIYSGSCASLQCEGSNDDTLITETCDLFQSSVVWFGQAGVTYYIRVHGFGTTRGQFELSLKEIDLADVECQARKEREESRFPPVASGSCACEAGVDSSQTLTCTDTCVYCNGDSTVCASKIFGRVYPEDQTEFDVFEEYTYTEGQNGVVRVVESDCTDFGRCSTCSVFVGEQQCNTCSHVDCIDSFGLQRGFGKAIDCSNIVGGAVVNECDESKIESGVLQVFSSDEFRQCQQEPLLACEGVRAFREMEDERLSCSCSLQGNDALLTCQEADCQFCNDENTVCMNTTFGNLFSGNFGDTISAFRTFTYIEGRDDSIRYDYTEESCTIGINGDAFQSCEVIICPGPFGSFRGFSFDCSNVEAGAVYNSCDAPATFDTGVFEVFSSSEFGLCLGEIGAEQACLEEKESRELEGTENGFGTICECTESTIDSEYILTCRDFDCIYCNFDATVCAEKSDGKRYSRFGQEVGTFDSYSYIESEGGRNEKVVLEAAGDECSVTVNDQECTSCTVVDCGGPGIFAFDRYEVNCENVPDGGSFGSGCNRTFVDTGVLEFATESEFRTCIIPRSPRDVCLEQKSEREEDGFVCECLENEFGGESLTCVDESCLTCNSAKTACGYRILGTNYGRKGQDLGDFRGFKYIEGLMDTVLFGTVFDPSDSRDCFVSINDVECTSCNYRTCFGVGIEAQCDNVDGGTNFNQCSPNPIDGVLASFSPFEFNECIEVQDPLDYCESQKALTQASQFNSGTQCECTSTESGARLSCFDSSCQYCNEENERCKLNVDYGLEIGRFGFIVGNFETVTYITGGAETVRLEESISGSCSVYLNGDLCNSCERVRCDSDSGQIRGLQIDCDNVLVGATFSECDTSGSSFFEHFGDDSYSLCRSFDGTLPPRVEPVTPPTQSPASGPSDEPQISSGVPGTTGIFVVLGLWVICWNWY